LFTRNNFDKWRKFTTKQEKEKEKEKEITEILDRLVAASRALHFCLDAVCLPRLCLFFSRSL
jgi:hypothetical protein